MSTVKDPQSTAVDLEKFATGIVNADGICVITLDMKDYPTNLYTPHLIAAYHKIVMEHANNKDVKGYILQSAKKEFLAGADLNSAAAANANKDPQQILEEGFKSIHGIQIKLRDIEKVEKPKVSIINGACLGGGYEVTLSTNHRIAVNNPKIKIGLPEVQIGVFPGGGGASKLPYILGIQSAIMFCLQAKQVSPVKAVEEGIIHATAETPEAALEAATKWIQANPRAIMPWDDKKHKIPGGGLIPGGLQVIAGSNGNLAKMTHGNIPGPILYLQTVYQGLQLPIDRALELESRNITKAFASIEARHMIRTLFVNMQKAKKGKNKPKGHEYFDVKKLGILGAGMMGAGIAYSSAMVGMDVVLKDVSAEAAQKGKDYSVKLLDKAVKKGGSMTREKADAILARITPTANNEDLKGCDLIIEAVFENIQLKDTVTKESEVMLAPDKVFASNTSTLPISLLAKASARPDKFIGIHFFSPVDKMQLVEIIVGKQTSEATIAAAVDYVTKINKIPIVVNDSRGFYTSRVFGTYPNEASLLLEEGVSPVAIERIAKKRGMMVGPLAVTDEVSQELVLKIASTVKESEWPEHMRRNIEVVKKLTDQGRLGKKVGKGYYEYTPDGKNLWKGLDEMFPRKDHGMTEKEIGDRLLHRMALETYRCLEEGVLRSVEDGDIGSIFGFGFAPFTGGTLSYIDYIGLKKFVADCDAFAAKYGDRFQVPDSLRNRKSMY
jgi:3-hydroxyacyl-CoA dehydrogenase / enoyl-CoA hydratase / 3-hydroxybutyryl-CoA epimerase